MTSNPIMTVTDLHKTYGKAGSKQYEALKGINFNVNAGEFVGIMGASGSGKTTLLNMLATLDKPTSGQVTINQQPITHLKGNQLADFRAKEIGFIFQDFNLLETMTAYENIALPLTLQNTPAKKIKPAVAAVATHLGINDFLTNYPNELSGGQKQRVAAARALINEPAILFGDEPTGALDSKSARELLELFTTINAAQAVSILLVTHDPFSASYCQRILFIKDGQIEQELKRGTQTRQAFYQQVLDTLGTFEQ
ncbi:bacitracin ABC transporter ATP-binding protein [Lactobacillus sp. CBA3606]|uniref:ABC transporter ATP-binding protein n=1 Tax=Lactobacillus sp. CBA3606 TaxID=2099789 RepID=UPI000CFB35A7|nr:ABC transporter ATP-binding protein [Lactobacillus sp. CBA3606]AVK63594.1 bacitracin ABC transporter ATP-binding protein [Lactobacillus sp. CBA3606]